MNFNEFKNTILLAMQRKYPNKTISVQKVEKNNKISYDALIIYEQSNNCTPTIYLNDYYQDFCKGSPLHQIIESINSFYISHKSTSQFDISFFYSFDQVKDKIVFKLINYSKNKDLLSKVPYIRYLDLAITFYCQVESDFFSNASILIYNHHLNFWKTNKICIYEHAKKNTPLLFPAEIKKIYDIFNEPDRHNDINCINSDNFITSNLDVDAFDTQKTPNIPMYVLTNLKKINGASCLLYNNVLSQISNTLNSDYYILPSSIHEIIIIPAEDNSRYQELSDMVSNINASQLAYEEILSDHVYFYSRITNTLNM